MLFNSNKSFVWIKESLTKNAGTGPNYSRELATFLTYHMPLRKCSTDPIEMHRFFWFKKKISEYKKLFMNVSTRDERHPVSCD